MGLLPHIYFPPFLILAPCCLILLIIGPVLAEDCPENWIDCGNGRCVHYMWRCDNDDDCGNMKDEEDCHLPPQLKCLSSQFQCVENHRCIPNSWFCDGENDCKDGSDEKQCNETTDNCGFRCRNGHCIPSRWRCDGETDCPDGSDEENCNKGQSCQQSEFSCSSGKCLKKSLVCDGKKDCPGGEDEGSHCGDACDNSTCQHKCKATPAGAECYCNLGYELQKDGKRCSDINECSKDGFCSHKCINTVGGYSCSCFDGYSLKENRTCLAEGPEPLLIFATTLEMRGVLLRTQKYFPIRRSISSLTALDVDPEDSRVYWSDVSRQGSAIYSSYLDGSGFRTVIKSGLLVPEDIALDWIGRNLYIIDSGMKQVLVCKIDGSFCSVLHEDDVDKPRSIEVDPSEGLVYWTDWGKKPGILRSGMDGSQRRTFVSTDIQWPNSIAIDHTTNRLYWCDAKTYRIEYITLDGKNRKVILQETEMFHPYSLSVFEDTIYWTDWKKFSVDSCSKFTGHNQKIIARENGKHIVAVHVYHPILEKRVSNPCWSTLCSHMCVLSPFGKHSCLCPPGFYLASDKITCKIDPKSSQILLSDGGWLLHVQPRATGNTAVTTILKDAAEAIGDIAYDRQKNMIFFSDTVKNVILILNVTSMKKEDLIKNHIQAAEGLDYDWMGNNLYWTDFGKGTIEVFALTTSERKILVSGLKGPKALALLPEKGLMFVSVTSASTPHISMFDMDGKNEKIIPFARGLPLSLAIDPRESLIYYLDPKSGVIGSVDYLDPKAPRNTYKYNVEHATSIAVSDKFMYWTTTKDDLLYRAHLNISVPSTTSMSLDSNRKVSVRKLKFFKSLSKNLESSCSPRNGGCSHMCLINPSGRTCECPVSFSLGPDLKTCTAAVRKCSNSEIKCAKGSDCIPKSWVCDGTPDCHDGSDEENCGVKKCPDDEFQCKNGRCITTMWKCDFSDDCGDNSDEENCNIPPPCRNYEFDCGNGLCISHLWRCDGERDCSSGKDEDDCHLNVCKSDQVKCDNGRCIPISWSCDGIVDCQDKTDENNCPVKRASCKLSEFRCQNGICIDNALLCDHRNDCQDNSDEQHCVYNKTCKEGMFRCDDGLCIYDHEVCDGNRDCENGEDEKNCTVTDCENAFYCSTTRKCIPLKWVCDGDDDCGDAADEHITACDKPVLTQTEETVCTNFTCNSGECLPWDDVCNGIPDCLDYSDEGNLCTSSCGKDNGGCSHLCVATPSGPKCSCLTGFKLERHGRICEDEDECLVPTTCSQYCNNTKGGYKCSCAEGFFLSKDHRKCKAVGGEATLLYLLPDQIRGIELMSNSNKVYVSTHWTDIRGMDYDASTGIVFWSEWREVFLIGKISQRKLNRSLWTAESIQPKRMRVTSTKSSSGFWMLQYQTAEGIQPKRTSGTISSLNPESHQNDMILHELQRPYYLKWDWIGQNLYYTTGKAHIRACNRNGTYCTTVMETKTTHINSLELAPGSGLMFWSVWSIVLQTGSGIIERSNMDGSGRIEIINTKVVWPSSLAVDHIMNLLYWADVRLNIIESTDFNGLNRRTVVQYNLQYPHSIALFEDLIYIADWGTDRIIHCSKLTGGNCTELHKGDVKAEVITVVHRVQQPTGENRCLNRCNQLCFLKPEGYSCSCDEKYKANNSSCVELPSKRPTTPGINTRKTRTTKKPEVCVEGFCLNGGKCKIISGERYCWCENPYKGRRCAETFKGMENHTADYSWIVAVLFGLFLVATFLLIFLLCRRKKEKLRKLSENVSIAFRNPRFSGRRNGRLVMDTDDPIVDELMLGRKGAYKASEFKNPLFGQPEPDPEQPSGEFQRWSSYDSEDSAFVSEYQAKGSTLNVDQEALIDPPKKDKILSFFRKQ